MLTLTRKTEYALISLTFLARRQADEQGALSARGIADRFKMPSALVSNILKELCAAGIIKSTRGKTGGYAMGIPAKQVSILDVVGVIEGGVQLVPCCQSIKQEQSPESEEPGNKKACCEIEDQCPVKGPLQRLQAKMNAFLGEVSLADLLQAGAEDEPCQCGCGGVTNITLGQTCMGLAQG